MGTSRKTEFEYDVCLSFAGEDRKYVASVAAALKTRGIRVFYDEYEEVTLWGKDLYEHLHEIYSELAHYCVIFISKHYGQKLWTSHERKSAQERAFKQHSEYILPARFDTTQIPGMRETVGYVDLGTRRPEVFAELIARKLGKRQRADYFPPNPNRLFEKLPLNGETDPDIVESRARAFFEAMLRTEERERKVVFAILVHGCSAELPENMHINVDLLRRVTGIAPLALKRIVGRLSSLGFSSCYRREHGHSQQLVKQDFIELQFDSLRADSGGPSTEIIACMAELATEDLCSDCSINALMHLDFGQLSSATYERDRHKTKLKKRT